MYFLWLIPIRKRCIIPASVHIQNLCLICSVMKRKMLLCDCIIITFTVGMMHTGDRMPSVCCLVVSNQYWTVFVSCRYRFRQCQKKVVWSFLISEDIHTEVLLPYLLMICRPCVYGGRKIPNRLNVIIQQ